MIMLVNVPDDYNVPDDDDVRKKKSLNSSLAEREFGGVAAHFFKRRFKIFRNSIKTKKHSTPESKRKEDVTFF